MEKCEGGMQGFGTPIVLMENNQRVRCKKTFENWMRVSGSKLHIFTARLKNGLNLNPKSRVKTATTAKCTRSLILIKLKCLLTNFKTKFALKVQNHWIRNYLVLTPILLYRLFIQALISKCSGYTCVTNQWIGRGLLVVTKY